MDIKNNALLKEMMRFAIAGSCGFVTDYIITLLLKPSLGYYIARIPAFLIAVTVTWVINRTLTFKGKSNRHIVLEYLYYIGAMLIGGALNYAVYAGSIKILTTSHASLVQGMPEKYLIFTAIVMGTAAGTVLNFLFSKFLIFNKKENSSQE